MKKIAVLLLAAVFCFIISGCGESRPKNADKDILYHLDAEPTTLDPQVATDESALIAITALFEGLVRLDADGQPIPGVAKSWTANETNTSFTFSLREDAKWSNGDPVTANDFVYAFRRAVTPSTQSQSASSLFCIENAQEIKNGTKSPEELGVTAVDTHTLVVNLAYSYPHFPELTATAVFMPCNETFFLETSGKYGLETTAVLGNGPFVIAGRYSWEHGVELSLSRNTAYSGEKSALPASLTFSIGSSVDTSDAVSVLLDGTVDAIEIPDSQLENAQSQEGISFVSFEDTTWGLCFNTENEVLKNENIRKALLFPLNREALLSHLPANTKAADDMIAPATTYMGENYRSASGASNLYLKGNDTALQTLQAGLSQLESDRLPNITILCPEGDEIKMMLNEMLTVWSTELGYYFSMEPLPEEELAQRVESGDYQIALYSVRPAGDGPAAFLSLFTSSSQYNPAHLKDASYDSLLTSAQSASGETALSYYLAAEQYLNDHAIFYPIYYQSRFYASAPGVTGIIFRPYNAGIDFINAGKENS